jgi:hypothetical protein
MVDNQQHKNICIALLEDTAPAPAGSFDSEMERKLRTKVLVAFPESKTNRHSPPCRSHGARIHHGNDWPNATIWSVDAAVEQTIIIEGGPFDYNNIHHPTVCLSSQVVVESSTATGAVPSKTAAVKPRRETVRVLAAKLVRQMQKQQKSADETSSASITSTASTLADEEEQQRDKKGGMVPFTPKRKKTFILIGEDGDDSDVLVFDRQLDFSSS